MSWTVVQEWCSKISFYTRFITCLFLYVYVLCIKFPLKSSAYFLIHEEKFFEYALKTDHVRIVIVCIYVICMDTCKSPKKLMN